MVGLSNEFVENVGKKLFGNLFYGVFPCDAYPNIKRKNFCVIFNLAKHNEDGSHFVTVVKSSKTIFYFDSFGRKCKNSYILKFMNKFSLPIEYNDFQIQDRSSSLCGLFCIFFIIFFYYYTYDNCFTDFASLFNVPQVSNKLKKKNDVLLKKFIFSFIKKIKK